MKYQKKYVVFFLLTKQINNLFSPHVNFKFKNIEKKDVSKHRFDLVHDTCTIRTLALYGSYMTIIRNENERFDTPFLYPLPKYLFLPVHDINTFIGIAYPLTLQIKYPLLNILSIGDCGDFYIVRYHFIEIKHASLHLIQGRNVFVRENAIVHHQVVYTDVGRPKFRSISEIEVATSRDMVKNQVEIAFRLRTYRLAVNLSLINHRGFIRPIHIQLDTILTRYGYHHMIPTSHRYLRRKVARFRLASGLLMSNQFPSLSA